MTNARVFNNNDIHNNEMLPCKTPIPFLASFFFLSTILSENIFLCLKLINSCSKWYKTDGSMSTFVIIQYEYICYNLVSEADLFVLHTRLSWPYHPFL